MSEITEKNKAGGWRKGAGRKIGSSNKIKIKDLISVKEVELCLNKAMELVNGVKCAEFDKKGEATIYERAPDAKAITFILEQVFGKAEQSVSLGDGVQRVIIFDLVPGDLADPMAITNGTSKNGKK